MVSRVGECIPDIHQKTANTIEGNIILITGNNRSFPLYFDSKYTKPGSTKPQIKNAEPCAAKPEPPDHRARGSRGRLSQSSFLFQQSTGGLCQFG